MDIKNQKKIAREFIFFIICLSIAIITFISIYPYNYLTQTQAENLNKEIIIKTKITDSIIKINQEKTDKQMSFTLANNRQFKDSQNNSDLWKRIYQIAKNDSIKYKWERVWDKDLIIFLKKLGYENPDKFSKFIKANMIKAEDLFLINKLDDEIRLLDAKRIKKHISFIDLNQQFRISKISFLISIIILFVIRYVIYGTIWSIKILKQNK